MTPAEIFKAAAVLAGALALSASRQALGQETCETRDHTFAESARTNVSQFNAATGIAIEENGETGTFHVDIEAPELKDPQFIIDNSAYVIALDQVSLFNTEEIAKTIVVHNCAMARSAPMYDSLNAVVGQLLNRGEKTLQDALKALQNGAPTPASPGPSI